MNQKMFDRQLEFQKLIGTPTSYIVANEKIKATNIQLRRAIDELNEALRELPYDLSGFSKNKKPLRLDPFATVTEIADAQLFIINALNVMGISYEEFSDVCMAKQNVNNDRFKSRKRFVHKPDNFLIVIEGPDGVGKTEICKHLSQLLGYQTLRMPDIDLGGNNIETLSQFYRRVVGSIDNVFILDRFFPSSIVYGEYFNRDVNLKDLSKLSNDRDIFTFVIDADKPFRPDLFINEDQWFTIRDIYIKHAKQNKWKVINNNTSPLDCAMQIIESLQF